LGWRAQRVADTAVGAAVSAGEKVAETVKPLRSQTGVNRQISTLQRQASTQLRKAERRGATARRRAEGEFERRVDDAQTAAEDLARRVRSEAKAIT